MVCATKGGANSKPLIGVVFEPFEEVKKELDLVPTVPQLSLARHKYVDECEAAVNEQIKWVFFIFFKIVSYCSVWKIVTLWLFSVLGFWFQFVFCCQNDSVEYNVSYVYHAMYAYFDRDNVALKGIAK